MPEADLFDVLNREFPSPANGAAEWDGKTIRDLERRLSKGKRSKWKLLRRAMVIRTAGKPWEHIQRELGISQYRARQISQDLRNLAGSGYISKAKFDWKSRVLAEEAELSALEKTKEFTLGPQLTAEDKSDLKGLFEEGLKLGTHAAGASIDLPTGWLNETANQKYIQRMSPAAQQRAISYVNARESLVGYQRVLSCLEADAALINLFSYKRRRCPRRG
jgi:hypothetical protein